MDCECKKRRIEQARLNELQKNWPEYRNAQLKNFKPRSVRQENAIRSIRENPSGNYYLTGYYQQGKTHLLVAQYRWMMDAGKKCILLSAQQLMEDLRKAEAPDHDGPPYQSPVLRMVDSADSGHLFIDDIEKAPTRSGFRAEMLFTVLDRIKRRQLGLSVTSNVPLISDTEEDLRRKLTDEVAARVYQICRSIDL